MDYKVSYDSKAIYFLLIASIFLVMGCKTAENLPESSIQQQNEAADEPPVSSKNVKPQDISTSEKITVTYTNHSSNIQINLDPNKDQFYMDLSGMTPQEKDSVIVLDSTLIKNRAIDIQTLLAGYRKAQDLFYQGDYRQALEEVDKTIEIQETADAYALKGTIFFMLENITAARANWNKAVQMDPNIPVPSIPELETLIEEIRGEGN